MDVRLTHFEEATRILDGFVSRGELTAASDICDNGTGVTISYIEVPEYLRRNGMAKLFLEALKAAGVRVDISYPREESLPFWAAMHTVGLIPHSPYEYTTWENA